MKNREQGFKKKMLTIGAYYALALLAFVFAGHALGAHIPESWLPLHSWELRLHQQAERINSYGKDTQVAVIGPSYALYMGEFDGAQNVSLTAWQSPEILRYIKARPDTHFIYIFSIREVLDIKKKARFSGIYSLARSLTIERAAFQMAMGIRPDNDFPPFTVSSKELRQVDELAPGVDFPNLKRDVCALQLEVSSEDAAGKDIEALLARFMNIASEPNVSLVALPSILSFGLPTPDSPTEKLRIDELEMFRLLRESGYEFTDLTPQMVPADYRDIYHLTAKGIEHARSIIAPIVRDI